MLLEDKVAVVYGAGGAVGSALVRTLFRCLRSSQGADRHGHQRHRWSGTRLGPPRLSGPVNRGVAGADGLSHR